MAEPMTGSAAHADSPIRRRPSREAAQVQIAQAALLLNEAARSLARWGSEADVVVTNPFHRRTDVPGNWQDATLEDRCNLAKMVGEIAWKLEGWAEGLAP